MDSINMIAATGSYQFKIDHSKTKDTDIETGITSPKFRVGPHDWTILYYPQGNNKDNNGKYMSVFLELPGGSIDVLATSGFALLDKNGNISYARSPESANLYTPGGRGWGYSCYLERTKLEDTCVNDGYFVLQVSITVKNIKGADQNTCPREHFKQLRLEDNQTDITFDVDGQKFEAHRLILAAHSPVFKAQLFNSKIDVTIKDMKPSVFKAMIDFMYSGSVSPSASTLFLQLLVAAADHYEVPKLKAICEHKLVEHISLSTILTFLESAEKHNCSALKEKCLQFCANRDNMHSLVLTEEYIKLMHKYPSLLDELRRKLVNDQDQV